jgi:hypothetical protein
MKELSHTIKPVFKNTCVPTLNFTNLLNVNPFLAGLNCTLDHTSPKLAKTMEFLIGVKPTQDYLAFFRQYLILIHLIVN